MTKGLCKSYVCKKNKTACLNPLRAFSIIGYIWIFSQKSILYGRVYLTLGGQLFEIWPPGITGGCICHHFSISTSTQYHNIRVESPWWKLHHRLHLGALPKNTTRQTCQSPRLWWVVWMGQAWDWPRWYSCYEGCGLAMPSWKSLLGNQNGVGPSSNKRFLVKLRSLRKPRATKSQCPMLTQRCQGVSRKSVCEPTRTEMNSAGKRFWLPLSRRSGYTVE